MHTPLRLPCPTHVACPCPDLALVALPLGVELVFRGVLHGVLATGFRIGRADGPWRLSVPTSGGGLFVDVGSHFSHVFTAACTFSNSCVPFDLEPTFHATCS